MLTLVAALLVAALQVQSPTNEELRAALDALRDGKPGEAKFDAALADLPALIESDSGFFIEAGAYLAGQHARKECVPSLMEALKRQNARPAAGNSDPKRFILDALIQLNARVPVDVVMTRPEQQFSSEMYLLLDRDAEHRFDGLTALLDLKWIDQPAHWAAAFALTDARDARIAAHLLSGWIWEFELEIFDDPDMDVAHGGSIGGSIQSVESWPPQVSYDLRLPDFDEPLYPIKSTRKESKFRDLPHPVYVADRKWNRARLLRHLLGKTNEVVPFNGHADLRIVLPGGQSYATRLRDYVGALREHIAWFESEFRRMKLIGEKEVLPPPTFRVRVADYRSNGTNALPKPEIEGVTYEY